MALIKCPECGHEVSDTAANCPNCGYQITKAINTDEKKRSDAIPVICGVFGIAFPIIFGWYLFAVSPLTLVPSILLLFVGIICLAGIGKRTTSKVASVFSAIGIAAGLMCGIIYCVIFFVIGILEIIYYSKL